MKKLILCSLFVILTSCSATPTSTPAPATEQKVETEAAPAEVQPIQVTKGKAKSCICAKLWMPVCGVNKKTYGNACEAECAGVKYTGGACAETK